MKNLRFQISGAVSTLFLIVILSATSFSQTNPILDSIKNNITAEHKMLAQSKGVWTGAASFWISADKPPFLSTSVLNNHMDATGRFLISEIEGNVTGAGRPFTGVRITGYDPGRKVFTRAMIQDGNPGVVMEGEWDEITKSFTMNYKQFDNKGIENSFREVYTFVDEDTEILEIYRTQTSDGKDFRFLKVVWNRKK